MFIKKSLAQLRNKAPFNRSHSFMVDILLFDWLAIPLTNVISKVRVITPNMVTIFSGILGLIAAFLFFKENLVVGTVAIYFSFLLDCVDGDLARKTKRTSAIGATLDKVTDTIKKSACIIAFILTTPFNLVFVISMVIVHYILQRLFPQHYSDEKQKEYAELGLEPLFSSYDLLVILLLFAPIFGFTFVLILVVFLQIVIGLYSRNT